jgi:hypothetical protein
MPLALARARRSAIGSAPGDSTKMTGVALVESLAAPSRSKGGLSMNLAPRQAATKALTP